MVDVHNKASRHRNMAAIRNKNTGPERDVRKLLVELGLHYSTNDPSLPGTPDIVLVKYKAVIFVHGCFWHGHDCHLFRIPQTRTEFWMKKIANNRKRDLGVNQKLQNIGFRVLTVWECALKGRKKLTQKELVERIEEWVFEGGRNVSLSDQGLAVIENNGC